MAGLQRALPQRHTSTATMQTLLNPTPLEVCLPQLQHRQRRPNSSVVPPREPCTLLQLSLAGRQAGGHEELQQEGSGTNTVTRQRSSEMSASCAATRRAHRPRSDVTHRLPLHLLTIQPASSHWQHTERTLQQKPSASYLLALRQLGHRLVGGGRAQGALMRPPLLSQLCSVHLQHCVVLCCAVAQAH